MTPIERLWRDLHDAGGEGGQRRIDSTHPHDIYADFASPERPGLVVLCATRPAEVQPLRSLEIATGRRSDGQWALHLTLIEPSLVAVFAALCVDIIEATRAGVPPANLAAAVITRIERWRALMLRDRSGLDDTALRGLIGELHILETMVLPTHGGEEAVRAWVGPDRRPQDFLLSDGARIEVKAATPGATSVTINGLAQLDTTGGPLTLAVVRMQATGADAPGRITAPLLIARIRAALADTPTVRIAFEDALSRGGWHEHPSHDDYAVLISGVDRYVVDATFPALTATGVPTGVTEARYVIQLPPADAQ
jgi:hypothetical protein